jgi:hypothetical protein
MEGNRMRMVRRVQSAAADIDRQAHMFCDLMAGHGDYIGPPDEEIRFARVFNKGLDMQVTAHHKKIFAKYSQLIHREGSGTVVLGRYKFFLFEEDRIDPFLLEKQPFYSFEFDAGGQVLGEESLLTSPALRLAPEIKAGFTCTILSALYDRMTER